jgi:hypothetical protein
VSFEAIMRAAPEPKSSFGPYPLWALMVATVICGLLLAFGRWLAIGREALELAWPEPDKPAPEWCLMAIALVVVLMIVHAARRGALRTLLRSRESPVWYGGVLILTSAFFRFAYGYWGSNKNHYSIILWNKPYFGRPVVIISWPIAYGAIGAVMSYVSIVSGRPSAYRWRWALVGLFLAAIAAVQFVFISRGGGWSDDHASLVVAFGSTSLVVVSLAITAVCVRGDCRKAHLMDLIAALWLLPTLDPRTSLSSYQDRLGYALRSAGPGYRMHALGTVLILAGALASLFFSKTTAVSCGTGADRGPLTPSNPG